MRQLHEPADRGRLAAAALAMAVLCATPVESWAQGAAVHPVVASQPASATARALRAAGIPRVTEEQGIVRAIVPGDSLWEIAGAATGSGVDRNQAMAAILRRNPEAFPEGNIHVIQRGLSLVIPSLADIRREDPQRAAMLVVQHRQAYLSKSIVPMPLYPLAVTSAPGAPMTAVPSPSVVVSPKATPPGVATPQATSAASEPQRPPAPSFSWAPLALLVALGALAVAMLLRRRRGALAAPDVRAEQARASQMFADSRLDLESQLEVHPEVDSEPMYSTLDEPVDVVPASVTDAAVKPMPVMVLRNGEASERATSQAAAASAEASGGALALALSVAHAYADVSRPEAARRWLRAIDARGAGAFQQGA